MSHGRPPIRALAFQAGFRCRSSGACCSSGWEIPIEPEVEGCLRTALGRGELAANGSSPLRTAPGLPHGATSALGCAASGRCVFFDTEGGRLCAIQSRLGQDALPSACRHFPRVVRLSPAATDVTLSHYCPTVAGAAFQREDEQRALFRIVEDPECCPSERRYEGLDARDAMPPLLRPGVLMTWAAHERWEAHQVTAIAGSSTPELAIARLTADAERLRWWTAAEGDFDRYLDRQLIDEGSEGPESSRSRPVRLEAWNLLAAAIPRAARDAAPAWARAAPTGSAAGDERERADALVDPAWPSFTLPIRLWLAARAFASWLALQGDGVRTTVAGLWLALEVLRVEALRGCRDAARPLDAELLREALRRADLLLLHLADPDALARRLSRCEQ